MDRRSLLKALAATPVLGAPLLGGCGPKPASGAARAPIDDAPSATSTTTGAAGGQARVASSVPATQLAGPGTDEKRPLRVLCVSAHPDDAECGCGGTLARLARDGHRVTILYVTRGESDGGGRSFEENGAIRSREAEKACKLLGASPRFLGMRGGSCEVTAAWRKKMAQVFEELDPDLVFTHWPLDTHFDHQVAAMLTVDAYLAKPRQNPLYFFEVETGRQTIGFTPHVFVDIGEVLPTKNEAIMAHASQSPERLYEVHHEPMERFRAREIGGTAAEAFAVMPGTLQTGFLPGL